MGRTKGLSAERIAVGILEKLGFEVIETSHVVKISETEVVEIDILARDGSGEAFAVEVKAGKGDVSSLRHAYANASIAGYKPMLICKGFSDDAAKLVAEELGVKVIELSEFYLLLEPEELETIVRNAMTQVLDEYGFRPIPPFEALSKRDLEFLELIHESRSFDDISSKVSEEEWRKRIGELRKKKVLPKAGKNFKDLKEQAGRIISQYDVIRRLDKIEKRLRDIEGKMD
ncbi:MAG: recombinase RecB [Candidatus Hydrothermarchaeales archaeon]